MSSAECSLLPSARKARSATALANLAARADTLACAYELLLADWPALVQWRRSEADQIAAMLREYAQEG